MRLPGAISGARALIVLATILLHTNVRAQVANGDLPLPELSTFTRADITGNDVDCGQGSGRCRICGDVNTIEAGCRANTQCKAFTFDNSCGFLKSAAQPQTYREGYTVFVIGNAGSAPPPAAASTPSAPPTSTSQATSPAPPAGNTVQVSAEQPSSTPAATPVASAPVTAPVPAPVPVPEPPAPQTIQVSNPVPAPSPPTRSVQVESGDTGGSGAGGYGFQWGSGLPFGGFFIGGPGRKMLSLS